MLLRVLHSICQKIWKPQQSWPQDWKRSVFIPIPKKGNGKECSNYCTIVLISHASKVMLKFLQARLQKYVNRKLQDIQAGFRKGRGTRGQMTNIHWITEKARELKKENKQTHIYFCFTDYTKAFDCVDYNKLKNSSRDRNTRLPKLPPEKSVCRSRGNRTRHGAMDWFQMGKGVRQGCILSPCLFKLYAEYFMRNAITSYN